MTTTLNEIIARDHQHQLIAEAAEYRRYRCTQAAAKADRSAGNAATRRFRRRLKAVNA
jgi:hypothetical protein